MNPRGAETRNHDREAAELVRRVGQGDEEAFSRLYDLYSPLLFSLAWRMLGQQAEAEDALQEVMLHVWRKASSYDPTKASARTWLIILARSRCLDRLRRRGVVSRRELPMTQEAFDPPEDRVMAMGEMEQEELRLRVRAALKSLPEPQRRALEAAYFDDLTQAEISARTGEPLGTVKTRMRLGMLKLAELLRGEEKS